jgi:hypothetical protein
MELALGVGTGPYISSHNSQLFIADSTVCPMQDRQKGKTISSSVAAGATLRKPKHDNSYSTAKRSVPIQDCASTSKFFL